MPLTTDEKMAAYERLTRHLRSMHHTERTALDTSPNYWAALLAAHEGRDADARALTEDLRTTAGDRWRSFYMSGWGPNG